MDERICNLINGYIDETLDAGQLLQLQEWIRDGEDNAKQFADYLYLHTQIHAKANAHSQPLSTDVGSLPVVLQNERALAYSSLKAPLYISTLAALLLILIVGGAFWFRSSDSAKSSATANRIDELNKPFVHVAQLKDAVFDSNLTLEEDQALGKSTIVLASGLIRLLFDDGVEVTLQGPAEYTLIGPGQTRLQNGVLAATVPAGAEGFTVKTPSGDVIDLGTAFGIELDATGNSKVSVFEGEVEVHSTDRIQKERLTEGMAVKLAAGKIEPIEFESDRFDKVWPVSSGIKGSTGDFRFAPAWRPLKMIQSDSTIFVVPEKQGVILKDSLTIDIASASSVKKNDELTHGKLDSGIRVKSFLLQFNPTTSGPPRGPGGLPGRGNFGGPGSGLPKGRAKRKPDPKSIKRISGDITFDRPVLGLIVTEKQLNRSDEQFLRRKNRIPLKRRGLELRENMIGDVVTLSEDRRTVSLSLNAIQQMTDQVRVIVDDSLPDFDLPK